jgi:hypothetical protein
MQDTSLDAERVQLSTYRRMGGERRVMIALDLSESLRELARARIRKANSDFDDRAVEDELIWELYGYRRVN